MVLSIKKMVDNMHSRWGFLGRGLKNFTEKIRKTQNLFLIHNSDKLKIVPSAFAQVIVDDMLMHPPLGNKLCHKREDINTMNRTGSQWTKNISFQRKTHFSFLLGNFNSKHGKKQTNNIWKIWNRNAYWKTSNTGLLSGKTPTEGYEHYLQETE